MDIGPFFFYPQITNEVPVPDHGYDGGNQSTSLYIGPSPIGNELVIFSRYSHL